MSEEKKFPQSIVYPHSGPGDTFIMRRELVAICDDNHCAAAILSTFLFWTDVKIANRKDAKKHNSIRQAGGLEETQDIDLWIFKTQEDIFEELLGTFGKNAINTGLKLLVTTKGFLERRNHPVYSWDRTLQYRVNLDVVQSAVNSLPPNLKDAFFNIKECILPNQRINSGKIKGSIPPKLKDRSFENNEAIPKQTTQQTIITDSPKRDSVAASADATPSSCLPAPVQVENIHIALTTGNALLEQDMRGFECDDEADDSDATEKSPAVRNPLVVGAIVPLGKATDRLNGNGKGNPSPSEKSVPGAIMANGTSSKHHDLGDGSPGGPQATHPPTPSTLDRSRLVSQTQMPTLQDRVEVPAPSVAQRNEPPAGQTGGSKDHQMELGVFSGSTSPSPVDAPQAHMNGTATREAMGQSQGDSTTSALPSDSKTDDIADDKKSARRVRKPSVKKKLDPETQEKVDKVFDGLDIFLREVTSDPEQCYARTKVDADLIVEKLLPCKPTWERVRKVYMELWNRPRDEKSGFFWQEHMTVKAICNNYQTTWMALAAKSNGHGGSVNGQPVVIRDNVRNYTGVGNMPRRAATAQQGAYR